MKQYTIPRDMFYVSADPYGKHISRSSLIEREFFFVMQKFGTRLGKPYYSTNVRTQQKFGHLTVDGYIPETKTVVEFKGCFVHCHRGCIVSKIGNNLLLLLQYRNSYSHILTLSFYLTDYPVDNLRNYKGVTQAKQNMRDAKRVEFLLDTFPNYIKTVEIVWECEWVAVKKKCMNKWPEFKDAIKDFYERDGGLVLRDCVRGGKVEAFTSFFSINRSLFKNCVADYFDLNSLYPSTLIKNSMPSGPPLHIRGDYVTNIRIIDNKFYYGRSRKRIYGALYVKIWIDPTHPIKASFYPFLPIKHENKSFCVTCRTCMLKSSEMPCLHSSVKDRAWKDHYTTVDLEYALSLGYKIVTIYEALAHFEVTDCLAKNFQHLAGKKCATAYPTTVTPSEKAGEKNVKHVCSSICKVAKCPHLLNYVEEINEELKLFPISEHDIENNKAAKEYFKIVMNSQIGKFAQNNLEKVHSKLIREASETYSILSNPRFTVCAANLLSDSETLLVQYFKDGSFEKLNRSFSCILGAFVTAYARVTLHESI